MSARPGFLIATASMLLLVGCKQDPGQRGQQSTGIAEGNRTARLPVQSDRYVLPPSKSPAAPASGAFAIAFKDEIWGEQKYLVGSASDPLPGKSIRATDLART
ncbi:MAG: hypothetical protein KJO07_05915, partial [Deltaproteobacteria bacterium]|nr:hypothetical protein [Deltaproteobacteria bacterium]